MKKRIGFLMGICLTVLLAAGITVPVKAEGYTYQSESNLYLISQTSGNVTQAVNEALAAAQGSAQTPAVIRLAPGTYQVGSISVKNSNVLLDVTDVVLQSDGSATSMLRIADGAVAGVTIKGGKWEAAGAVKMAFFISGTKGRIQNLTLDGCEVYGAGETNVRIEGVSGLTLNKLNVHDSGYGLLVLDATDIVAQECVGSANNLGLAFRDAKGVLSQCQAFANSQDGLQIKESNADIVLNGGSFSKNSKNGISLTTGAKLKMSGVNVSDNESNGISPVGAKGMQTALTADQCAFDRNGRHGVAADKYIAVNLTDCTANNNRANGVYLNDHCTSTGLIRITANGNGKTNGSTGGSGILIQNSSTCQGIKDCSCDNNSKLGISLQDVTTSVENCSISGNGKHGLFLSGKEKAKVAVESCVINGNKTNGIMTSGNKTVQVKKTTISKSGNCGIEAQDCTIKVTGKGNTISGSKKHGIVSRAGKLIVSDAVVENNKNYGVYFEGVSKGSSCVNSKIRNNLVGITLSASAVVDKVSGNTIANNSKYNLMLYAGKGKNKTTLKACKKNKFSVKKKTGYQISFEKDTKVPAGIKVTKGKAKKDSGGNTFTVAK